MRLALVLALVSACGIPGDRFFKPGSDGGGSDGGGSDGSGDAPGDGPPLVPLRHGYVLDSTGRIFLVDKDLNGRLSLSSMPAVVGGAPTFALAGTNAMIVLDSVAPPTVRQFAINADGSLLLFQTIPMPCTARFAAVSATIFAMTCDNGSLITFPVGGGAASEISAGAAPHFPVFTPDFRCLYVTDAMGTSVRMFSVDAAGTLTALGAAVGPASSRGIAVHPNGLHVYVGGNNSLQTYDVGAGCVLTRIGSGLPIGASTQHVVVDPSGKHVFVTNTEVFAFDIKPDGTLSPVAGSPFLVGGNVLTGAIFDPALPTSLYLTSPQFGGTFQAFIAANGSLTMGPGVTTGTTSATWFAMAP